MDQRVWAGQTVMGNNIRRSTLDKHACWLEQAFLPIVHILGYAACLVLHALSVKTLKPNIDTGDDRSQWPRVRKATWSSKSPASSFPERVATESWCCLLPILHTQHPNTVTQCMIASFFIVCVCSACILCLLLDYLFKIDSYTSNNTVLTARTLSFRVIL